MISVGLNNLSFRGIVPCARLCAALETTSAACAGMDAPPVAGAYPGAAAPVAAAPPAARVGEPGGAGGPPAAVLAQMPQT